MEDMKELKAAIDDLQTRLDDEARMRSELERRCRVLEKLAYRDPGTGLRTEPYLHERVREEIERSIRYPSTATLLTFCTPRANPDMMTRLGLRLTDDLRMTDQVFTLSEGGLAVLLVETPEEGAHKVLHRLKAELEQVLVSFGYSLTSFPVDANLAEDFLNLAMERHNTVARQMYMSNDSSTPVAPTAVH
ncbi:MAG TPA: GGDEF domain-containing protein [Candidatus Hydrogenedentes bacterium]|nr:GGDEF domain-containing protein [Candidatus Hydrogenedentota bacterium]